MKTILEWLKPGARVKRYMLLQVLSIAIFIFCVISLKSTLDLTPKMLIAYIALITLSSFGIIFSFILAQKNILFISLKNISKKSKNVKVKKLLYGDPSLKKGPNIVVIGGGSGLPNLLKGLKEYTSNITAIVNVSEDEVTLSPVVHSEEDITPGDIRKCITALSTAESDVGKLLTHKSKNDYETDYSVGNKIISSLIEINGSFAKAIEKIPELFKMQGRILPVTTDNIILCAGLDNGEVAVGKENICNRVLEQKTTIKQIFLKDGNVKELPEVRDAIKSANVIVIGPGPLYTSVASNFLIGNVSKEIVKSKAKKVYISNIMNQPGQTDGYTLARYINEIERYIGKHVLDFAIINSGEITGEMIKDFNQDTSTPVKIDLENIQNRAISIIKEDLVLTAPNAIIHNNERLAEIILSISKSKKIGNLNIVKIKKKHMQAEKKLKSKKVVKNKISKTSKTKEDRKKLKKTSKNIEPKISKKSNDTINKIKNSIKY